MRFLLSNPSWVTSFTAVSVLLAGRLIPRKEPPVQLPLPSGETVDLREKLKGSDKFAVQKAIKIDPEGEISGGIMTLVETTLMCRLIEGWSLDAPLPSTHSCDECTGDSVKWHEHVADYIGITLDLDDFNEIEGWLSPHLSKVMQVPNLETSPGSGASS